MLIQVPGTWYLTHEVISLIVFSQDYLWHRVRKSSSLQRSQKPSEKEQSPGTKDPRLTLQEAAHLSESALFWPEAPLHQSQSNPAKGRRSLSFIFLEGSSSSPTNANINEPFFDFLMPESLEPKMFSFDIYAIFSVWEEICLISRAESLVTTILFFFLNTLLRSD